MASSLKSERKYHVFLSFRGEDVRNNFLGHLYKALDQKGIYTYVDNEELRKGEQIDLALMKAIEESQIAIIVFSKDYASSWWCLEELVKIIDCKKERDLMVFPLFYKVEPRELRTPRGSYRDAMVKHESKYGKDSKEVKRWEKALSYASYLSGWPLKDGDESVLIQRIVTEISTHLDRTLLHVAMHPVGIDSQVDKLKSMLNLESDDNVLMVGLWGQGGIGKTTLAKAVYNDIFNQFENSCFLANVREVSNDCKDLVTLQVELLFEILALKERLVVSNVARGIHLIQERLCRKKVFLILDDVNDLSQLHALVGEGKWFHNGSRIMVTTRDSHLLTYLGIDQDHVYEVKELDDSDARELFSKHAFPTHQNFKIRTDLVDSVLNHAKGLPLALEVMGSFLRGRREYEWESALDEISTTPKKGINDVLKISYGGLEPKVKEIFLHIACFFKGWDNEYVKKVLHSCDLNAVIGLKILMERSLIRIESRNIQMHDLIQLMGMDIVNQESDDPGRRSRLWLHDDIVDVLSSDMGNCAVKAIVLDTLEPIEICVDPEAFTKMRRLRLLILRNVHNTFQGPICLPNELRWFQWDGGAPWIPKFSSGRKKLVGFQINNCSIPIAPNQFKDFQNLKYIYFRGCESLVHTPDLSCTPNIEELDFSNCKNLVETHESVAYLDKLRVLNLKECYELSVFPNVLKTKNLQALHLYGCPKFEKFPDIPHKLESLKELRLEGIAIKELPISIENLIALERMHLHECKNLLNLPSSIYKLQNLESLEVQNCPNLIEFPKYKDLDDPCMKTGLSNLRELVLGGCNLSEVEFLENLSCFPLLEDLTLTERNITTLPTSISKRDHLFALYVGHCHRLQEIPELPPFLSYLFADDCKSLQKNENLTSIHHLVHRGLADTVGSPSKYWPDFRIVLPEGEMPQWAVPIEEGSISFMISEDLYEKILGWAFCIVLDNDEHKDDYLFDIVPHANGKRLGCHGRGCGSLDSNHIFVDYLLPYQLWEVVDFAQIDRRYVQFSLTVSGRVVKEWGLRIMCKQLGNDLKVELRDNQLINPTLLYEVGHESTDSPMGSSLMHEDNSSEVGRQDSQDCQMSTRKHSQIGSKRKCEFTSI
ncbi:TMV resistance protein N-like [Eucalyptus grandis]|uniref:TMV resistance protein N-like n=1 Tax=Eucalyptus grandis TaxID=71139 RepID=UPI00192EFBCB|nr:TMV resistance protein N-like [Eucalyptus grandis]